MDTKLVGSNAVIVARQFNPSVFSQLWLVDHNLMIRDEFQPESENIFSPIVTNVTCSRFKLVVVPDQLQFFPSVGVHEEQELVSGVLGAIVALLPHTPYAAAGLNFVWHASSANEQPGLMSRQLFYQGGNPLYEHFATKDATFGAFLSKAMFGCRLNLSVKPVIARDTQKETIEFVFNYHADFADSKNAASEIGLLLKQWSSARSEAEKILESVPV